jgi:putative membrane protein
LNLRADSAHGHGPQEEGMEMFWYGPQMGWGWAMGLGSLVFWVLLVVAIVVLVRSFTGGGQRLPFRGSTSTAPYGQPGPAAATPEQVLAARFARGEIDEDEFHQRMAALRAEAPHPGTPS